VVLPIEFGCLGIRVPTRAVERRDKRLALPAPFREFRVERPVQALPARQHAR
jgi:hypothetical protein